MKLWNELVIFNNFLKFFCYFLHISAHSLSNFESFQGQNKLYNGKTLLETFVIMQGALNKEALGKTLCSNDINILMKFVYWRCQLLNVFHQLWPLPENIVVEKSHWKLLPVNKTRHFLIFFPQLLKHSYTFMRVNLPNYFFFLFQSKMSLYLKEKCLALKYKLQYTYLLYTVQIQ